MAREASKKSFLDFFKMKDLDDEDEFDDDLFDDDDDDDDYDYQTPAKQTKARTQQENTVAERASTAAPKNTSYGRSYSGASQQSSYKAATQSAAFGAGKQSRASAGNKLVDFSSRQQRAEETYNHGDVYVIRPLDINDAQTIAKYLKTGLTIVINLEGVEVSAAQRIIDFVGGSCYALNGSINGISENIFIAAPKSTEVSGDLREELMNSENVTPQLRGY